jgi:hypothetical protein
MLSFSTMHWSTSFGTPKEKLDELKSIFFDTLNKAKAT